MAVPSNRVRIASGWLLDAVLPRQPVQLGLVQAAEVPLTTETREHPVGSGAP